VETRLRLFERIVEGFDKMSLDVEKSKHARMREEKEKARLPYVYICVVFIITKGLPLTF